MRRTIFAFLLMMGVFFAFTPAAPAAEVAKDGYYACNSEQLLDSLTQAIKDKYYEKIFPDAIRKGDCKAMKRGVRIKVLESKGDKVKFQIGETGPAYWIAAEAVAGN